MLFENAFKILNKDLDFNFKLFKITLYKIDNLENLNLNVIDLNYYDIESPILYRDTLNKTCKLQCYNINEIITYIKNHYKPPFRLNIPILSTSTETFKDENVYWNLYSIIWEKSQESQESQELQESNKLRKTSQESNINFGENIEKNLSLKSLWFPISIKININNTINNEENYMFENILFSLLGKNHTHFIYNINNLKLKQSNKEFDICKIISKFKFDLITEKNIDNNIIKLQKIIIKKLKLN